MQLALLMIHVRFSARPLHSILPTMSPVIASDDTQLIETLSILLASAVPMAS